MVDPHEREEWQAVADADELHLLPKEALIASMKHLAHRLLELVPSEEVTIDNRHLLDELLGLELRKRLDDFVDNCNRGGAVGITTKSVCRNSVEAFIVTAEEEFK